MHGKERNFDGSESSEYPVRNGLESVLGNRAANRIKDGRGGSANEGHDRHPHLATGRCDSGRRIAREDGFRFVCERTGYRLTRGNNAVPKTRRFTRSRCLHAFNICERSRKAWSFAFSTKRVK